VYRNHIGVSELDITSGGLAVDGKIEVDILRQGKVVAHELLELRGGGLRVVDVNELGFLQMIEQ
jgi:hypothetical protein